MNVEEVGNYNTDDGTCFGKVYIQLVNILHLILINNEVMNNAYFIVRFLC